MDVVLHLLHNVQPLIHNLVDCGLLLHLHVLVRYRILGTILRNLRFRSLLGHRKPVGVLLGLLVGTWLGLDWVHLRLTLDGTAWPEGEDGSGIIRWRHLVLDLDLLLDLLGLLEVGHLHVRLLRLLVDDHGRSNRLDQGLV